MNRKTAMAATLIVSLVCLSAVPRAEAAKRGFYAGGGYGESSFDLVNADFDAVLLSVYEQLGLTVLSSSSTLDTSDSGYEIVGGYRFLPWLAFEASYLDIGTAKQRATSEVQFDGESFAVDSTLKADLQGLALSALGIWQLSERFDLYARAGLLLATEERSITLDDGVDRLSASDSDSNECLLWGAGLAVHFAEIYSTRLEFRQVLDAGDDRSTGEGDVEFISLGIVVAF